MSTQPAPIGHNRTPFDDITDRATDVYAEAENWLDGEVVKNEGQAEALTKLSDELKDLEKERKAAFTKEKAPHLTASKAVDDKWRPLKDKLESAIKGCKASLTPWRVEQKRLKDEAVEAKRRETEGAQREAVEALRQSNAADMGAREEAEANLKAANRAQAQAKRVDRTATGLRTTYVPVLTNITDAIKHYWKSDKAEFTALLQRLATADVRIGKREIPGFKVEERKSAS